MLATGLAVLFFPVSAIVDDLLVRIVVARYIWLLAIATILCNHKLGILYTLVILAVLADSVGATLSEGGRSKTSRCYRSHLL
jgi:hypothetical protein